MELEVNGTTITLSDTEARNIVYAAIKMGFEPDYSVATQKATQKLAVALAGKQDTDIVMLGYTTKARDLLERFVEITPRMYELSLERMKAEADSLRAKITQREAEITRLHEIIESLTTALASMARSKK